MKKYIAPVTIFLILLLSLMPLSAAAPVTTLPGGLYADLTSVFTFDESDATTRVTALESVDKGVVCGYNLVTAGAASGKALQGYSTATVANTNPMLFGINLKNSQGLGLDWSDKDGIMFYLDISGMEPTKNNATGCSLRIHTATLEANGSGYAWIRNTNDPKIQDISLTAYYYQNGAWHETDESINDYERIQFPAGFKGWVYVPFEHYVSRKGASGLPERGVAGLDRVTGLTVITGPYDGLNHNNKLLIDDIYVVRATDTPSGTTAPADTSSPSTADLSLTIGLAGIVALIPTMAVIGSMGRRRKAQG